MEMNKERLLPIGSVVLVKGSIKKLVIVARGLAAKENEGLKIYDYGAVTYPEGLVGENLLNFDADSIEEVIYEGYSDKDEERMEANIESWLEETRAKNVKGSDQL